MILKGIVSSIDFSNQKIEVILPEYDNVVTKPLPVYGYFVEGELEIEDFVIVAAFNDDINDGIILKKMFSQESSNFVKITDNQNNPLTDNYGNILIA